MIRPESWEDDLYKIMPDFVRQVVVDLKRKPSLTPAQIGQAIVDQWIAWKYLGCFPSEIVPSDVFFAFSSYANQALPAEVVAWVDNQVDAVWADTWPAKPSGFPAPLFE